MSLPTGGNCSTTRSNIFSKLSKSSMISGVHWSTRLSITHGSNSKSESSDMSDVSGDRLDMKSSIFSSNILVLKSKIKLGIEDYPDRYRLYRIAYTV